MHFLSTETASGLLCFCALPVIATEHPFCRFDEDVVGKALNYEETSMFKPEYKRDGRFLVVGPSATKRVFNASVEMKDGLIAKVK